MNHSEVRFLLLNFMQTKTRYSLMSLVENLRVHPTNLAQVIEIGISAGLVADHELKMPKTCAPVRPTELADRPWWDGNWNPWNSHKRALRKYFRELKNFSEHVSIARAWAAGQTADFWRSADGPGFERLVALFFRQAGWSVKPIGGSNDGGIDLVLRRGSEHVIVQCKAHRRPLSPAVLRELYGALLHSGADGAVLACFDGVTPKAKEWIKDKPIVVLTLGDFVKRP